MRRTAVLRVTYDDPAGDVYPPSMQGEWAYTLRMGGLEVDDDDVGVLLDGSADSVRYAKPTEASPVGLYQYAPDPPSDGGHLEATDEEIWLFSAVWGGDHGKRAMTEVLNKLEIATGGGEAPVEEWVRE